MNAPLPIATNADTPPRTLAADRRGAIMVIGLLMGVLLVGALWNIVSVGDAIVWRERLQDTADAAAFEAAVWNARGMNVIVFLNIVMSGAMALLVAVRGTVMFMTALVIALNAARAACLFPATPITLFLCSIATGFAPTATSIRNQVSTFENRIHEPTRRFMLGVQQAQVAVATLTPLLGVFQSALRTSSEYDIPAVGISPSLLPTSTSSGPLVGGEQRAEMPRIGLGVSLPVALHDEETLCEKAGGFVPNELLAGLERAGLPDWLLDGAGGFFKNVAETIAGTLPSVFCGSSPVDIAQLTEMFQRFARDNCKAALDAGPPKAAPAAGASGSGGDAAKAPARSAEQQKTLDEYRQYWDPGYQAGSGTPVDPKRFNVARCEQEELARMKSESGGSSPGGGGAPPGGGGSSTKPGTAGGGVSLAKPGTGSATSPTGGGAASARNPLPAQVWSYTQNGDFFMQAWGLAYHDAGRIAPNDTSLDFPAPGTSAAHPADPSELGTAQAEMYWDTSDGAGEDCDGSWDKCGDEAMWLMRWKARMRRLHNPVEMAARSGSQVVIAELANAIDKGLERAAESGVAAVIGRIRPRVAELLKGKVWNLTNELHGRVTKVEWIDKAAELTVGEKLSLDPPTPDQLIIH